MHLSWHPFRRAEKAGYTVEAVSVSTKPFVRYVYNIVGGGRITFIRVHVQ